MTIVKNKEFNSTENIKYITDITGISLQRTDDIYYPTGKVSALSQADCDKYFLGNRAWRVTCYKNEDEDCKLDFVFVFCDLGLWVGNLGNGFGSGTIPETVWVDFHNDMGISTEKTESIITQMVMHKIIDENPQFGVYDSRKKIIDKMQRIGSGKKRDQLNAYANDVLFVSKPKPQYNPDLVVLTGETNSNGNHIFMHYEIELSDLRFNNSKIRFKIKLKKAALSRRETRYIFRDENYFDYLELIEEFHYETDKQHNIEKWQTAKLSEFLERGDAAFTKI